MAAKGPRDGRKSSGLQNNLHRVLVPFVSAAGGKFLNDSIAADELFDVVELGRQEIGEVLVAFFGDHDDVFVAVVEPFLGNSKLRVDREDVTGLQNAARIGAVVVHGHADRVREDAAAGIDQPVGGPLVDRLGELGPLEDVFHRGLRLVADDAGRHAGPESRHDRVAIVENELQDLALNGAELAVDRPHPRDVTGVVTIFGREIHQDQVAVLEHRPCCGNSACSRCCRCPRP